MIDPDWYNDSPRAIFRESRVVSREPPASAEKPDVERRDAIRRRTRRKAVVVVNSGWSTLNAEILNQSVDGALVQLDGIGAFPDSFQLRFDGMKKNAIRIWTRGLKAGVQFER